MAKRLYEESNIQNIANAIREKNGETTTYKTSEMAAAILGILTTIEPFVLTGNCSYLFEGGKLTWLIKNFNDKLSTDDITAAIEMFSNCGLTSIPVTLNFYKSSGDVDITGIFKGNNTLETLPTLFYKYTIMTFYGDYLFYDCHRLRTISSNFIRTYSSKFSSFYLRNAFTNCFSLRSVSNILTALKRTDTWGAGRGSYSYIETFMNCYALDSIENLPVVTDSTPIFRDTFKNCGRLKGMTFELRNNTTPYDVSKWSGEYVLDLSSVGYFPNSNGAYLLTTYNSGITTDKQVRDDATYQALKNDPDWWSNNLNYSRYNRTSAVNTIKSLPNNTSGDTLTIKFNGSAGALTQAGAINTMTEAEAAVATSKGWTIAFV